MKMVKKYRTGMENNVQWRNIMEHQTNSCFTDYSCKDFITVLSGKSPVPGGGGAAALAGAIGIALGNMVGSLTVGKKTYAAVEEDIIQCKKKADEITARLLDLVEKDATPEEIEKKAEVMEAALVGACEVPLEIMRTCAEAIDLIETFAEKGSKIAISDAGVGATLLKSALQGASLNIYINTKSMADKEAAASYNKEADELHIISHQNSASSALVKEKMIFLTSAVRLNAVKLLAFPMKNSCFRKMPQRKWF